MSQAARLAKPGRHPVGWLHGEGLATKHPEPWPDLLGGFWLVGGSRGTHRLVRASCASQWAGVATFHYTYPSLGPVQTMVKLREEKRLDQ